MGHPLDLDDVTNMPMATATEQTAGNDRKGTGHADDQIYQAIRHAVLTQRLPAGSRLPEINLSEIFGTGRSVVRRALTRLAADSIIVMRRNQTARVVRPTQQETRDIFAARRLIEAETMRLTAGHLDTDAGRELLEIVDREREAHKRQDHDSRIELSLQFHLRLCDYCPNAVFASLLRDLILRTSVTVALYKVPNMGACYSGDDHASMIRKLMEGDAEAAATTAIRHLDHLEERLLMNDAERPVDLASILRG